MPKSILDDPEVEKEILQLIEERKHKDTKNAFKASDIFEKITERVIGQDMIAMTIAQRIEQAALVRSKRKPITSILICGPTGTGKTELAKTLADAVYGEGEKYLFRVDCGSLGTSEADISKLIGQPKGIKDSHSGSLPQFLNVKKKGVLLFDELEKAVRQPEDPLAQVLLAILDEGRVESKRDSTIYSANECIIVMTSNAKQSELATLLKDFDTESDEAKDELEASIRAMLQGDVFSPEFLARIDFVTTVLPLDAKARVQIAEKIIHEIAADYDLTVDLSDKSIYFFLVDAAEKFEEGNARTLARWISDHFKPSIVKFKHASSTITDAALKYKGEELVLAPVKKK